MILKKIVLVGEHVKLYLPAPFTLLGVTMADGFAVLWVRCSDGPEPVRQNLQVTRVTIGGGTSTDITHVENDIYLDNVYKDGYTNHFFYREL